MEKNMAVEKTNDEKLVWVAPELVSIDVSKNTAARGGTGHDSPSLSHS